MKYMLEENQWITIRPAHDVISTFQPVVPFGCCFCMLVVSLKHFSGRTYVEAAVISYG